jgi:hypothetical protein
MKLPFLQHLSLVGGTALALRYGHRVSVDLDLFGSNLDRSFVINELKSEFGTAFLFEETGAKRAVFCFIEDVKVDIVHYTHRPIAVIEEEEGIRMYSDSDIAAMKINAILGRGRKKGFGIFTSYCITIHYSKLLTGTAKSTLSKCC